MQCLVHLQALISDACFDAVLELIFGRHWHSYHLCVLDALVQAAVHIEEETGCALDQHMLVLGISGL